MRIGISGTPGVGKSSLIEALGVQLADSGRRVAVLAVDPSSARGRGAILGDKTRMPRLSSHPGAFVRPSPSGTSLGGVAAATSDAVELVDAFGFDVVLIETVGVGQSESAVSSMSDLLVLLVAPGGGDDLQGIKRGVLEVADFVVVNKTDGDLRDQGMVTAADYRSALSLIHRRQDWPEPMVLNCSSFDLDSVERVWTEIDQRWRMLDASGALGQERSRNRNALLDQRVRHLLSELLDDDNGRVAEIRSRVRVGDRSVAGGAAELVEVILSSASPPS